MAYSFTNPNYNLILFFEFSKLLSLSDLFSQYKISLRWRNTHNFSSLIAETVTAFQHSRHLNRWRKNILSSFWHRLEHESARAPLCKLASCTRQIFLSKLKLLQTRQTGIESRNWLRLSIVLRNSQFHSIPEKRAFLQKLCSKVKSLCVQLARGDLTHSKREI